MPSVRTWPSLLLFRSGIDEWTVKIKTLASSSKTKHRSIASEEVWTAREMFMLAQLETNKFGKLTSQNLAFCFPCLTLID